MKTKLEKQMLKALKEAASVIFAQNNGNCLVSVLDAIDKADPNFKFLVKAEVKKTSKRLEKLKYIAAENIFYKNLCLKLTEPEFDEVVEIVENTGTLSNRKFTGFIKKEFLAKKNKTKHHKEMAKILLATRQQDQN